MASNTVREASCAGRFLEHMKGTKECGTSIEEQFLEALDN